MYQQSLVILKPDAVQRRLVGRILQRFEDVGLKIHAFRFQNITREESRNHYSAHSKKDFYPALEDYIISGPAVLAVLGGCQCIAKIRQLVGDTVPARAQPGTIRGDFAHQDQGGDVSTPLRNLVHASANAEEAAHEINLWFRADEIVSYSLIDDRLQGHS